MADYREISQEYAKQGINAALLLNGGAAVALLSQAGQLKEHGLGGAISAGLLIWAFGSALAAATWVFGFLSTRYVDKSEREAGKRDRYLQISDRYMDIGTGMVLGSIALFAIGCIMAACAFAADS